MKQFLELGLGICQADAVKMGGLNEWLACALLARRKRTSSFSAFSDDDLGSLKEASEQDDDAMSMGTGMPFSGALQPGREM